MHPDEDAELGNMEPSPQMKLWMVEDRDRWGFSMNVVRAETAEEACRLVGAKPGKRVEVIELPHHGDPRILWCYDESPDTNDRD